ncbi:MAG: hypothetical protein HC921_12530 [Synechococcaceae cyanobacterium SM2_3_1]|nr:hypothetical protein [Synechococcaceae cyanobacterium SM2_3_1]
MDCCAADPALPDRQWQVYSRLNLIVDPQGQQPDQLNSVVFAQHRVSGQLRVIYEGLPPQAQDLDFVMAVPLAWSRTVPAHLLIRDHRGLFQSDLAADQAVIWSPSAGSEQGVNREKRQPQHPSDFSEVVGWDPQAAERVLFMIGNFGEDAEVVSVGTSPPDQRRSLPAERLSASLNPDPNWTSPLQIQPLDWTSAVPVSPGPLCHFLKR